MKCKACGALNDAEASFCKGCGIKLEVSECSKCGTPADPDALFCSKCGSKIAANDPVEGKTCQSFGFVNSAGTMYFHRFNQQIL